MSAALSVQVWLEHLGLDVDLEWCGVILDAVKLAEIRAHNIDIERAQRRAKRHDGARKAAKTTAERRALRVGS